MLLKDRSADSQDFHGLTAISQPSTADDRFGRLPGTVDEVKMIKDLFLDKNFAWLNDSESTQETVLSAMSQSSWLHLACHGVQRRKNPMESAFLLYDGELNLHTISDQQLPNARLAFLSACQTATGDEDLPNEAAHLAAGMLMIGYHSVIGTMWSIRDRDAPMVAQDFYKYLLAHGMKTSQGEAAYALHEAVGKLRETVGVKEFWRWVPFIHLGI
jgi:CHAT domain-containing protein